MVTANNSMEGKICLVTGATSGIGRVMARELAVQGATLVLVARDADRGEATIKDIKAHSGNPKIEYLLADLSSQAQVRQLASAFTQRYDRLHVLINNAGAIFMTRHETVDGLEMTFALNYLAPFLLTHLLLDTLKASAPSRVINVASAAHVGTRIPFNDLQHAHTRYRAFRVYGESKLADLLFTYELARRLEGTGVTVNALHPGFVATNFGMGNNRLTDFAMKLARPFAIGPEEGAQTAIYLATSPDVEGVTGKYFAKQRPVKSSSVSQDEAAARRLWEVGDQLTGLPPNA